MRELLKRYRFLLLALLVFVVVVPGSALAQEEEPGGDGSTERDELPTFKPPVGEEETAPGEIIVKFKENIRPSRQAKIQRQEGLEKQKDLDLIGAGLYKIEGQSVERAIHDLKRLRRDVEYAEPNRKVYATGYADEPEFGHLWGLDNTGQQIGGTPDVDIDAKEASAVTQGDPNLVVAVIDDGVDFSHPDLANRAWKNPGESGVDGSGNNKETNGTDDDGNGYVDDVNGWNFVVEDNTVYEYPSIGHGTHVAGTIAASVNNHGVVGVAPNVQIMALKFLDANGSGWVADAVDAIGYAKKMGAKISNNSYGHSVAPPRTVI